MTKTNNRESINFEILEMRKIEYNAIKFFNENLKLLDISVDISNNSVILNNKLIEFTHHFAKLDLDFNDSITGQYISSTLIGKSIVAHQILMKSKNQSLRLLSEKLSLLKNYFTGNKIEKMIKKVKTRSREYIEREEKYKKSLELLIARLNTYNGYCKQILKYELSEKDIPGLVKNLLLYYYEDSAIILLMIVDYMESELKVLGLDDLIMPIRKELNKKTNRHLFETEKIK